MIFNKKNVNLSNSIYQQRGSNYGLHQKDGMLINNRPDGQTGIAQAAQFKKAMKRADKISMIADGVSLGEMRSEMRESISSL